MPEPDDPDRFLKPEELVAIAAMTDDEFHDYLVEPVSQALSVARTEALRNNRSALELNDRRPYHDEDDQALRDQIRDHPVHLALDTVADINYDRVTLIRAQIQVMNELFDSFRLQLGLPSAADTASESATSHQRLMATMINHSAAFVGAAVARHLARTIGPPNAMATLFPINSLDTHHSAGGTTTLSQGAGTQTGSGQGNVPTALSDGSSGLSVSIDLNDDAGASSNESNGTTIHAGQGSSTTSNSKKAAEEGSSGAGMDRANSEGSRSARSGGRPNMSGTTTLNAGANVYTARSEAQNVCIHTAADATPAAESASRRERQNTHYKPNLAFNLEPQNTENHSSNLTPMSRNLNSVHFQRSPPPPYNPGSLDARSILTSHGHRSGLSAWSLAGQPATLPIRTPSRDSPPESLPSDISAARTRILDLERRLTAADCALRTPSPIVTVGDEAQRARPQALPTPPNSDPATISNMHFEVRRRRTENQLLRTHNNILQSSLRQTQQSSERAAIEMLSLRERLHDSNVDRAALFAQSVRLGLERNEVDMANRFHRAQARLMAEIMDRLREGDDLAELYMNEARFFRERCRVLEQAAARGDVESILNAAPLPEWFAREE